MPENKNIVVVFKSKYGSAKRYAQWIAEELNADLFESPETDIENLMKYNTIIYGGSLYAVGILGFSLIKNNFGKIRDKKVIVFSVGASPAYPKALNDVKNKNFTEEMKEKVHFFHLRGAFDFNKLGLVHKLMMLMMKTVLKRKKGELTSDEKGMLACFDTPADWTSKKAISPIVECANQ